MKKRSRRTLAALDRRLISLAVASCFAAELAYANPTGPAVVSGTATFSTVGSTLTVTNSPNAILNWQGFSIGAGEATRFQQQSAASSVLNRVTGQDPSAILGTLWSNGRVFLVNPNGILFGQGSRVDVAGLVASTLNITDADFLGGRLNFQSGAIANSILNQGELHSATGGHIYLIAPDVTNSGLITSPKGEVVLAAGKSVSLVDIGTPNLKVEITAPDNEARNLGQIVAESGRIGVYAGLINQQGIVRADSVSRDASGKIVFRASDTTILDSGSVTSAAGARGGEIQVLGNKVGLVGDAKVDASGDAGGGTVLIGGDFQGKNPDVQNAWRTYVGPRATIKADAIEQGDGGKVIVWADNWTKYYGSISAHGGAAGGNGGSVEVSGKQSLDFNGAVDVGARSGKAGSVLLDPTSITIVAGASGTGANDGEVADGTVFFTDVGGSFTITNGALQALSGNITLQSQAQTEVNASLNLTNQTTGTTVTFQAGGNMNVNSPITTAGGSLILVAGDPAFSATSPTPGLIIASGANLTTNGGDITLQNQKTITGGGINIGANVNAGSGIVHMTTASGGIGQQPGGVITASALEIQTVAGVTLNESNNVGTLAASVSSGNNFTFTNAQTLVIGTVGGVSGIGVTPSSGDATININVTSGNLTVNKNVMATGGSSGAASITLTTAGSVTTANSTTISAVGGNGSDSGGVAVVALTAQNGGITLGSSNTVTADAGDGPGSPTASVTFSATSGVIASGAGSSISALSGNKGSGTGAAASISLLSSSGVSLNTTSVSATGGNTLDTLAGGGGADILVQSGGAIDLTGSSLVATGGTGTFTGTATATLKVATTLGNTSPSGDIIAHNITATAGDVELQQNSRATTKSIKRASATSLITATNLLMEVDDPDNVSGGSIGTSAEPMPVQVSNLEAHTHEASPGIFIVSPNQGLTIGGLPLTFFPGFVKGVQNVTSGDISISANGTLTTQAAQNGAAGCGFAAAGATGGPVCTGGSTITLFANNMIILNSVNAGAGLVRLAPFATNRDIIVFPDTVDCSPSCPDALLLSPAAIQQHVTAGTLEISRRFDTDTGTLTVGAGLDLGAINVSTLRLAHENVTVSANINKTGGADATLDVRAANSILFNSSADVTSTSNKLNVILNSDRDASGAGAISLGSGTVITSNGGDITLGGGATPLTVAAFGTASNVEGVKLDGAQLISGAGNISVRGQGLGDGGSFRHGVNLINGAKVQVTSGTLDVTGVGGNNATGDRNYGVNLDGAGTLISSTGGTITVTGTGGSGASQSNSQGVVMGEAVAGAVIQGTGSAIVNVSGTGGTTGGINSRGVIVAREGTKISAQNGAINIVGIGPSATSISVGVQLSGGGDIESTGSGPINITGTAQAGGLSLTGGGTGTAVIGGPTATGDIQIVGNQLIFLPGGSNPINVQTAGNVTLNAAAGVIQQGGSIVASGLKLTGSGTFDLNLTGNDVATLAADITGASSTLTYRDASALSIGTVLGTSGIANPGALTVTTGGSITQTAPVAVGGASTFTAGANAITLTNSSNDFTGAVSLNNSGANDVAITDANGITLGSSSVGSGTLTVNAVGITQTGPIVQASGAGAATFNAGAGVITLTNSSNDFTGAVSLNNSGANNVAVTDLNSITLGASSVAGGTLTVNAANIAQSGAITAPDVTFTADDMSIAGTIDAGTGTVRLTPSSSNRNIEISNATAGTALLLSPTELQQITAGTLEIGRSDGTGTLTVSTPVVAGNVNSGTVRLLDQDIAVNASFASNGNLALNATSNVSLQDASVDAGGTMDVSAGNNLSVTAVNAATNLTSVGAQTISAKGITLTGGGSGASSFVLAEISQTGPFTQSITAGSNGITLNGGNGSGGTNFANIKQTNALGSQTIVVNGGNVALLSGTGATTNSAVIQNLGTSQSITINDAASVSIVAQSADAGFFSANDQTVTIQGAVSANALTIGNATSANDSFIFGNNQAVTVGTTGQLGSITVQGGTAAGKNSGIFNNSGTQTVSTTGTLSLTGGSATGPGPTCAAANSGSCADIVNSGTGLQTVSANAIQIQGGSGGTYNGAGIFINAGDQQVTVGTGGLSLQGGGGVSNNFATIGGTGAAGRTISIDVTGDTTLAGGSTADSSAFIGLGGSGDLQTITVNFNGIGNLTLIGSDFSPTGAGSAIGAGLDVTNATTNLDISANNITLTPGTQSGVRFGHPAASNGPGDITVTAIGTIALNSASGVGSAIRTLGNVTLDAASITQGADSVIISGGATTLTGGSISLTSANNDFTGAVSLNNSGANNVAVTDANAIVLGTSSVGSGTLTVTAGGAITQTGPIVQAAGAGVASFQSGGGAITLTNTGNDFTGPIDAGAGLAAVAITDANSLILQGGGGGGAGGDFTLNANGMVSQSGALLFTGGNVVINAGVGPIVFTDPANNFVATSISANTAGAASLVNAGAVNLAASSIGGALSLTAGGVTQTGAITVGGTSTINAGANPITLTNAGNDFTGAVSVSNSGANNVSLTDANAITIGASSVGGTFDINALSVSFLGDFSASNFSFAGPSYTLQSGTLNLSGTTTVSGSTTVAVQGGTLDASSGTIDVAGTLQTTSGTLSANTVNVSGTFDDSGGTVSVGTLNVLSGGTLMGTGTITGNVSNSAGTVSPGASAGILTISGNYVQGPSGTLDMQIGGTIAGTEYDQLIVTGSVSLDGTLSTTLINAFTPAAGDPFTLIQSGGALTGTFGTIVQPTGTTFNTFYGPTSFEFIAQGSAVLSEVVVAINNAIAPTTTESIDALIEQEIAPVLEEVLVSTTEPAAGTPEEQKLAKKPPACN